MFFVDRGRHECVDACKAHIGKGTFSRHPDVRKAIEKVFLSNCGYCGTRITLELGAQIDHFIPKSGGHATAQEIHCCGNLALTCCACNGSKSDSHPVLDPCKLDESCNEDPSSVLEYNIATGKFFIKTGTSKSLITNRCPITKFSNSKIISIEMRLFHDGRRCSTE